MTFREWLLEQIEASGLSYSEIGRRGGISHARISQVVSGETPGADFCIAVARGLDLPPEDVLQRAGILPGRPPDGDKAEREVVGLFRQLSQDARDAILATMRSLLLGRRQAAEQTTVYMRKTGDMLYNRPPSEEPDAPRPRTVTEWMAYQIAEGIDELPEEDVRRLFDLMKRLRGEEESGSAAASEQVATDL